MTKSVNSYHAINGFVGLVFTLKFLIVSGRLRFKYTKQFQFRNDVLGESL